MLTCHFLQLHLVLFSQETIYYDSIFYIPLLLRGAVAKWLRCLLLNPGSEVQASVSKPRFLITSVLVGSTKGAQERFIYTSWQNLFHNQTKINIFKLTRHLKKRKKIICWCLFMIENNHKVHTRHKSKNSCTQPYIFVCNITPDIINDKRFFVFFDTPTSEQNKLCQTHMMLHIFHCTIVLSLEMTLENTVVPNF